MIRLIQIFNYWQKQPPRCFVEKGVLKNFGKLTGKQLCWSLFLIKLQASDLQLY